MKRDIEKAETVRMRTSLRPWIFPAGVVVVYLILFATALDPTLDALQMSASVLAQAAFPILLAFVLMFLLNRFSTPAHVTRYLGHGAGIKGVLMSALAGVISMGPVFAWYPFLKILKEKGASDFHLANFLSHRAVKPVLLPLMIIYFGWRFSLIFTLLNILSALLVATAVNSFGKRRDELL